MDDILPPWLGKLKSLKVLNLESNKFHGDIPSDLCILNKLQVLNLAQNNINGRIPPCFTNFTAMIVNKGEAFEFYNGNRNASSLTDSYIDAIVRGIGLHYTSTLQYLVSLDLSSNNIAGDIPKGLGDLVALTNLNLSSNNLEGKIAEKIGKLEKLESLDLSRNKLFGTIPPSLLNLNFLSHLNLSYNHLDGRIPRGKQLQTFDDPSIYVRNSKLCGEPVLRSCPGDKNKSSGNVAEDEDDDSDMVWVYAGIGPGMAAGFSGFYCVL